MFHNDGNVSRGAAYRVGSLSAILVLVLSALSLVVQGVQAQTATITVDKGIQYQQIDGFGAFGAKGVPWSDATTYWGNDQAFVNRLIDDMGVTILRDEVPTSFEQDNDNSDPFNTDLTRFNLNTPPRDSCNGSHSPLGQHLPYLRAMHDTAAARGEPIKLIATIWSPPAWMKYVRCIFGGDASWNRLIMDEIPSAEVPNDRRDELAEHLVAYVKIIKQQTGIDVYAISVQNEPAFAQGFQSSVYSGPQLARTIKKVGERFAAEGLSTKIFAPEDVTDYQRVSDYVRAAMDDPTIRQHVDLLAVHGYGADGSSADNTNAEGWQQFANLAAEYNTPLWMTETSGYPDTYDGAMQLGQAILGGLKYGKLGAWVWWSFSEEQSSQYSLMINGQPTKRYYASKQFYRYIRPGAVMVEATSADPDIQVAAFAHAQQKTLTTVLINKSSASKTFTINYQGGNIPSSFTIYRTSATENAANVGTVSSTGSVTLPANSITTLVGTSPVVDTPLAPSIRTQPQSTSAAEGTSTTFRVLANGTPPLSYQWRRNGVDIPNAIGTSYTVKSALASDNNAAYSVRVTSPYGSVTSANATLTVNAFTGLSVPRVSSAPTIDGSVDALWSNIPSTPMSKMVIGAGTAASDLSGTFKAVWDSQNLYVLADVTDDLLTTPATGDADNFEIFLDGDNSKSSAYGANDFQFAFTPGSAPVEFKHNATTNVTSAHATRSGGYRIEVKIPWSTVGVTAQDNRLLGFDASVNDTDGSTHESKILWNSASNDIWFNPALMGTAKLSAGNGSSPTATPIPPTATPTPTATSTPGGVGLRAEYYTNVGLTGSPALTRTDAQVNFDWGSGGPGSPIGVDNFSVRWTGQVEAPVSGSYTFSTISDDGVRLWLNGQQVINNWTDHAPTTDTAAAISLSAGQKVDLRMEFYERGGGAQARLLWAYPGQAQVAIPEARLYPASGSSPTATPVPPTATPVPTTTPTIGQTVSRVRFYPRSGWASRMVGGTIQGSNTSSSSGFVNLLTISAQPTENAWSELAVSTTTRYRYLRYVSPSGGYGNVAEVEFYSGSTKLSGTGFGTAGSWNNGGATFDKALDGNTTTFFDAPTGDGVYVGIDIGP